jgi:hypothetical protein
MFKLLGKADTWLDVAQRWGAGFVLAWAGLSWLAKHVSWLGDVNFADALALGLAGAMLLSLVISIALIAIRFFRPLANSQSGRPLFDYDPNGPEERIAAVEQAVSQLSSKMDGLAEALAAESAERFRLKDSVDTLLTKLDELDGQITNRFTGLDYAISAIGHREILLKSGETIEELNGRLDYPSGASLAETHAWSAWLRDLSGWDAAIMNWIVHASPYLPDVGSIIERVEDSWYERDWPIRAEDFPSLKDLRKFQRWMGRRQNWEATRQTVMRLVTGVAFHGSLPLSAKEKGGDD